MEYGTKHVGVRRVDGSREWETFDRETGNRIGMPHPSRWEAQGYAEHRQATTFVHGPSASAGTSLGYRRLER